ncbi:MAG: hypothetical protein HYV16_05175 [Gammaproteobacteria bacterium]|nr:hypothetical protein [Gammaproteobacteria bacterium]
MKSFPARGLPALLCALFATLPFAAIADSHIELAAVDADPDQHHGNGKGFALYWRQELASNWYAFGDYTRATVRTEPHLNIYERSVRQYFNMPSLELNAWGGLGLGHAWDLSRNHRLYLAASLQASDYEGDIDTGLGAHLGWQAQWSEHWQTRVEFNHTDTFVRDQGLLAELTWRINPRWGLSLRTRDHDEWDYSTYELGLRYQLD